MINDVTPPGLPQRPKPKVIEPLEKPAQTPLHELAAAEDPTFQLNPSHTFQTPEQIAAHEEPAATPIVSHHDAPNKHSTANAYGTSGAYGTPSAHHTPLLLAHNGTKWSRLKDYLRPPYSRKQLIIGGVLAVLLAFGIGATWTLTHQKRTVVADKPKKSVQKKVVVPPAPIYSTLSGMQITDASLNQKPVTAVMVENSVDARPQSGLGAAGVVFEAVAEGGVTRFMALYQDNTPTDVGPIRSARPYYVQWAMGFDAAYAHVGGSPQALQNIAEWGVKDMNQFSNGGYFHRISSRPAPHNVYTGINTLNELEAKKGYTSTFTGFTRKPEAASKTPNATSVDFALSGYTYNPHYDYVAATNSYNRSEAGQQHKDASTNTQLSPKVVIAMVVPMGRGSTTSSGSYYSEYNPIGSGVAYIFQDGVLTMGHWNKANNAGALSFTDDAGNPLPLNPGQTWISAVTATTGVTYK